MQILKLIYPKRCISCLSILPYNAPIDLCKNCEENFIQIEGAICEKCGKPLSLNNTKTCYDCQKIAHSFERGYAVYTYGGVIQNILQNFKYKNHATYGKLLARIMVEHLQEADALIKSVHLTLPIPIHKNKMRERGFNQAEILCKEFAKLLSIPLATDVLIRSKDTKPQSHFGGSERKENIKEAFSIKNKEKIKNKNILLIDDIFTTGSTIDECAELLKINGALKIYFYTVATAADVDY